MQGVNKRHTISALLGIGIAALLIWGLDNNDKPKMTYHRNEGKIFGTYYHIQYESEKDLQDSMQTALQAFDNSLSMFNPHSTLSAINDNRDTTTDAYFEAMFAEAQRVNELSGGAFDITVAPLVNYFGFGNRKRVQNTDRSADRIQTDLDSLLAFVGMDKVQLVDHRIIKSDPRVQLDGGAVAKGQACDIVADLLRRNGSENYLVEIGGEIVAKGNNSKGDKWHVGITKPVENEGESLQEVIEVSDICMATSGNYRNFYYEGNEKRSHTIDPRTGSPVQHSLLSATIISSTCMRADAMATASMVLGAEKGLEMIEQAGDAAAYYIVAQGDSTVVITSQNWSKMLQK